MDSCFSCKKLVFHETESMLFGWWTCKDLPGNKNTIGQLGGYNKVCEIPERRNATCFVV